MWQNISYAYDTHRMMTALDVQNLLSSALEEHAELSDYRQRDEDAFYNDTRAICRLDAVMEQIESISRARADQRLKDIQSALATTSSAPKKHMLPRLVHLRQSFPAGTSFERAHEIANKIRKIGMVEKQRLFVYIFEQTGMTTDELGKNFHMHARFYVKGKKQMSLQARWQRRFGESQSLTKPARTSSSTTTYTSSLHTWLATRALTSILSRK